MFVLYEYDVDNQCKIIKGVTNNILVAIKWAEKGIDTGYESVKVYDTEESIKGVW